MKSWGRSLHIHACSWKQVIFNYLPFPTRKGTTSTAKRTNLSWNEVTFNEHSFYSVHNLSFQLDKAGCF